MTVHAFDKVEMHRPAIVGHCYRMLGSAMDAEDAAQEALTRAWKSIASFDERSAVRTWLYRIATNVCLDEIDARKRRIRPAQEGVPSNGAPMMEELVQRSADSWIEPIADDRSLPVDPAERAMLRETIRLAFVAALQVLPAKQRAALLLVDVLDFSVQEAALTLNATVAAINSALQRARAAIQANRSQTPEVNEPSRETLDRFVAAFEHFDIDALTAMLREDANFSMPPYDMWLRGPASVRTWLLGLGSGCRGSRLVPTAASGLPAFAQYRPNSTGGHSPWALIVLEFSNDRIAGFTSFLDVAMVFPAFGMPPALPPP